MDEKNDVASCYSTDSMKAAAFSLHGGYDFLLKDLKVTSLVRKSRCRHPMKKRILTESVGNAQSPCVNEESLQGNTLAATENITVTFVNLRT